MKLWPKLLLIVLVANLAACAELARDRRDAPWDPKQSASLLDQIPAWDNAAAKICCQHLPRDQYIKERCDTDTPRPPRSNRC